MSATAPTAPRRRAPRATSLPPPGLLAAAAVALASLYVAWKAGVKDLGAVPPALAVGAAAAVLFGLPGYPVAAYLLPAPLRRHLPLLVLPVGACVSALALTVLGFAQLPLNASLTVVVGAGALGSVLTWRRRDPPSRAGRARWDLLAPAALALVIVAVGLLPMLRTGDSVLTGNNGDAVLATGVADFLQRTQPLGTNEPLYVDRMPDNWRSKYPIYYALAGIARLSGLPVAEAFPTLIALMLGLSALGLMLFAFHSLSAGLAGALLAMGLAGLDRILVYLTVGPFYNQLWGQFALAFTLLLGIQFVRAPDRRTGVLLGLFVLLGAFAYPLMLPFPLTLLAVGGLVGWRRAGSPRPPRPRLPRGTALRVALALGLIVVAPAVLVATAGVIEKSWAAAQVIAPGSDLRPWNALPFYLPFHQFFGLVDPLGVAGPAAVGLIAVALLGLRRQPAEVAWALGTMIAGALAFALLFRLRDNGAFFYFKILGFTGPIVLVLAVVALARAAGEDSRRAIRLAATGALAALALSTVAGARLEVNQTAELFGDDVRELRSWSRALPAGDSILLALPPSSAQLNATAMLAAHPLSSPSPLGSSTFPAVAPGLRADWVLTEAGPPSTLRSLITGGPRFANPRYRLYRGNPSAPGPDNSTQRSFENAPWARAGVPPRR